MELSMAHVIAATQRILHAGHHLTSIFCKEGNIKNQTKYAGSCPREIHFLFKQPLWVESHFCILTCGCLKRNMQRCRSTNAEICTPFRCSTLVKNICSLWQKNKKVTPWLLSINNAIFIWLNMQKAFSGKGWSLERTVFSALQMAKLPVCCM